MTKKEEKKKAPSVLEKLESQLGKGVIVRASDITSSTNVRLPSGIPGLDFAMSGGFPCGTMIQIAGPEAAGKTALAYHVAGNLQRLKGKKARILIAPVETPVDKRFARKLGFVIPWSKAEIQLFEQKNETKLTDEQKADLTKEICPVDIVRDAQSSEEVFTAVLKAAELDVYDLIIIDSVAAMLPEDDLVRKDKTGKVQEVEVGDETAYGRAKNSVVASFTFRFALRVRGSEPNGRPNLTTCLLINQVGAKIDGAGYGFDWEVKGSRALRHMKAADIWLYKGKRVSDEDAASNDPSGRYTNWLIAKGKFGVREGLKGSIPFYYDRGFDPAEDLFLTLKKMNLARHTGGGKWELLDKYGKAIAYYGTEFGGERGLVDLLRSDNTVRAVWLSVLESLYEEKPTYEWME